MDISGILAAAVGYSNAINLLTRNGAYMPRPVNAVYNTSEKDGQIRTVVNFDDGTSVTVVKMDEDQFDVEKAILYAVVKRAYGTIEAKRDEKGNVRRSARGTVLTEVVGHGHGRMIRAVIDGAVNQNASNKASADERQTKKASKLAAAGEKKVAKAKKPVKVAKAKIAKKPFSQMTQDEKRAYWRAVKAAKRS